MYRQITELAGNNTKVHALKEQLHEITSLIEATSPLLHVRLSNVLRHSMHVHVLREFEILSIQLRV